MFDLTFYQWANVIKGYALASGIAFAAVMVLLWWRRGLKLHRADREARAKRVYATYLLQAMQHPELARPGPTDSTKGRQRAQYQWFVGYLLTVCEEILLIDPSPQWREALGRQLAPHRGFLMSQAFREGPYRGLTPEVRRVITDALAAGVRDASSGQSTGEGQRTA